MDKILGKLLMECDGYLKKKNSISTVQVVLFSFKKNIVKTNKRNE